MIAQDDKRPAPELTDSLQGDGAPQQAEDTPGEKTETIEERREAARDERARKALRQLINLDEEENERTEERVSLRTILGGDILGSTWFRRQVGYVILIVVLAILYVSNRYACQREEIRREDLADTLTDRKFKVLTISSELTEFSMRSNVEENVPDTTLRTSVESSYYLPN